VLIGGPDAGRTMRRFAAEVMPALSGQTAPTSTR
jgi:hypothetical protein